MNSVPNYTRPVKAQRRFLTPAQRDLLPLLPLFQACQHKGLVISDLNRVERIRAVNRYCDFLPFDWISDSFKELLGDPAQIVVLADAIEVGVLAW